MEIVVYIDAPVASVIRAKATVGTIRVTVSAPGLAASQVTLEAVQPLDDRVPGIEELRLSDEGRVPVARDKSFQAVAVDTRGRIQPIDRDYDFTGSSRGEYRAKLDQFVRENSPRLDRGTEAYGAFLDRLTETLIQRQGHLVRDDYNFLAAKYDDRKKSKKK